MSFGRSERRKPWQKATWSRISKLPTWSATRIYRRQTPPVVEQYGGRFLVRAGKVRDLESAFGFDRLVIIEFPSVEAAQRFYDSPEYKPLLKLREDTTQSQVALVEGDEGN